MYSHVIRMSLVCHSYAICMLLVCTSMASLCHSYVLVCHPYVTRMYSYVIRMSLVCDFIMNPWIQVASYNNSWEICQHAIIKLSVAYSFRRMFFIGQNLKHVLMTYSFLKLLIFFLLTLIQKYKYSLFGAYFSPHQRNIVCK